MHTEMEGMIEHMELIHQAMGRAIASREFVKLLEHTGDMELLAGKAAQDARISAERYRPIKRCASARTIG